MKLNTRRVQKHEKTKTVRRASHMPIKGRYAGFGPSRAHTQGSFGSSTRPVVGVASQVLHFFRVPITFLVLPVFWRCLHASMDLRSPSASVSLQSPAICSNVPDVALYAIGQFFFPSPSALYPQVKSRFPTILRFGNRPQLIF